MVESLIAPLLFPKTNTSEDEIQIVVNIIKPRNMDASVVFKWVSIKEMVT